MIPTGQRIHITVIRIKGLAIWIFFILMMVAKMGVAETSEHQEIPPLLWMNEDNASLFAGTFPLIPVTTSNTTAVTIVNSIVGSEQAGCQWTNKTGTGISSSSVKAFTAANCNPGTGSSRGYNFLGAMTFSAAGTYYTSLSFFTNSWFTFGAHSIQFALIDSGNHCYVSECIPISCTSTTSCAATSGTYSLNITN